MRKVHIGDAYDLVGNPGTATHFIYPEEKSVAVPGFIIDLRNPQTDTAQKARLEIVGLLREITDKNSTNPATRFVTVILKQELPTLAGQGLSLCDVLAYALEKHAPNQAELNQLEQIAIALDRECSSTLARIKGKR